MNHESPNLSGSDSKKSDNNNQARSSIIIRGIRYNHPRINTISRWGILPSILNTEIEDVISTEQDLANSKEDNIRNLIIDLTTKFPDPTIEQELNGYTKINNIQIPTKKVLNKMQIIKIVLDKYQKCEENDSNNTDEESSEISISERLIELKKFINFFEQQKSRDFNIEDLKICL
ncbi:2372_t:CDS:2 [Ambispora leptoticha]|uniref:2372_t:CDS:1 n=1 Tax=Ambispora leptoticha TaxID=144679 RepID=A0A9N9DSQ8_9GLOM|nr:2372_t:CDS:2 [Ambispora leptoticha]